MEFLIIIIAILAAPYLYYRWSIRRYLPGVAPPFGEFYKSMFSGEGDRHAAVGRGSSGLPDWSAGNGSNVLPDWDAAQRGVDVEFGDLVAELEATLDSDIQDKRYSDSITSGDELHEAAQLGNKHAQLRLGMTFLNNIGGSPSEGIEWIKTAAEGGLGEAAGHLGTMYYKGLAVLQDYEEAARWYRMGTDNGDVTSQAMLGLMHEKGLGVDQDSALAINLLTQAAEQNAGGAQIDLARIYLEGRIVERDFIEGYKWVNLAVANGKTEGSKLRDMLQARMSKEDVAEGQARARTFLEEHPITISKPITEWLPGS